MDKKSESDEEVLKSLEEKSDDGDYGDYPFIKDIAKLQVELLLEIRRELKNKRKR